MFFSLWDKRIKIKQDTARRTNKSEIIKPQANKLTETKMNTNNDNQLELLMKLSKEIREAEDAKHHEEYPDHRICECACCIDCGCCECGEEDEEDEEDIPACIDCSSTEIKTYKADDCEHYYNICDICYIKNKYAIQLAPKPEPEEESDEEEEPEEEPEEESDEEEETPTCGFCGKDAGQSPIEHHKWDELYFCSEKCCNDYE